MMDGPVVLSGVLTVALVILAQRWWHERTRRMKAERHANEAIRDRYKLLDILEHRAGSSARRRQPLVAVDAGTVRDVREVLRQSRDRQMAESGGVS